MRLWTYHKNGFDITKDSVDPQKSGYYCYYLDAYARLWKELGTDQIIWCCTDHDEWPIKDGYEEWELEVDRSEVFRIVDDLLWNVIIGNNAYSRKLWEHLDEQFYVEVKDIDEREKLIEQKIKECQNPKGGPWINLFLECPMTGRSTVLLKCPAKSDWIIRRHIH